MSAALLLVRLLLLCLLLASIPTLLLADVAIPYKVYGPQPVSQYGMYALRSSYNQSYVPWNTSYPTVNIGLSLSLLGTNKEDGWGDFLAMLVDVTNFRGGVYVNGVPHYVSLTYGVDDGSPHLTQLIYSDMFHSRNYSAYIAPQTDALLQAILPILPASNATLVSTYNPDPADFSSGYPNLFGLLPPDDLIFRVSLSDINEQAQRYVKEGGGEGSVHGISTVCMLTVNESLPQTRAAGVRQWIVLENARRNHTDNITVLVDAVWQRTALDYSNYTAALAACPDAVDLMVLSASDSDGLDAALALQASQLRPKAVIGLITDRTIVAADPAQVAIAAGWVLPVAVLLGPATIYEMGGVFTDVYDVAYANAVWRAGAGLTSTAQNSFAYVYLTSFTTITAALTLTRSLLPEDMRAAMLALNGQTTAFSGIEFDPDTGYNTLLVPLIAQAMPSGQLVEGNGSSIQYPYNWPWRLPADGDPLVVQQSVNAVLIAVVISVLGAWVALIITEQSIYLKRQGSRYWPLWLFLVALALGGVSVWCGQLMISTALQTSLPGRVVLPMSYAFDMAILALLPSVAVTFVGLLVLMGDVESINHRNSTSAMNAALASGSDVRAVRQAEFEIARKAEEKKREASLSASLHFTHVRRCFTWRVLVGSALISAALFESRATLFSMWLQPATWSLDNYVWLPLWLFDVSLVMVSCLWLFHALRVRYAAAFVFAGTVLGDWLIAMTGTQFSYLKSGAELPHALLTANVGYTTVSLVSGIIAAVICFIFIGLQFSRMQLSRNGLSVLAATMLSNITKLQDKVRQCEDNNASLQQQLTATSRVLAHTTINTPIQTHYAYCMAQATTVDSLQYLSQQPPPLTSTNRTSLAGANTARSTKAAPGDSIKSSPTQPRRKSLFGSSETASSRPPLHLPSLTLTPTKSASVAPLPPLPALRLRGSTTDDTERGSQDGLELSRSVATTVESSPALTSINPTTLTGSVSVASAGPPTGIVRKRRTSISATSRSGMGGGGGDSMSRSKRQTRNTNRSYEEQFAQLLDQYSPYDSTAESPPAISSPGGGQSNKASLSIAAANSVINGGLAELLTHPACIAVIKCELQSIHSVENLVFYLHAQRYRQLQSSKLRKTVAAAMYETFIREGAEQQININARQRDGIGFCVTKRGDDSCTSSLFEEAQREVLQLMETNLLGSKAERQCTWLMSQMPMSALLGIQTTNDENAE